MSVSSVGPWIKNFKDKNTTCHSYLKFNESNVIRTLLFHFICIRLLLIVVYT